MDDFAGRVAIITGAARGLGLLVAQDLAREGMYVAGADMREDELKREMDAPTDPGSTSAIS